MRLLEVLYSFRIGGSELVGFDLAEQMSRRGVDVICAALEGPDGSLAERCKNLGIPVIDLRVPHTGFLRRNGLSLEVMKVLRSIRPDVIHMHHTVAMNKLALAAWIARIPKIVMTEHSIRPIDTERLAQLRFRALLPVMSSVTVVDQSIHDWFSSVLKCPANKLTVIPNGIDFDRWHRRDRAARRAALGITDETVFAFSGRLERVKRVPELITTYLRATSSLENPSLLLVVGGGSEAAQCEAAAAQQSHRHRVKLVGEQQDVRPFLAAADVFLMNSSSEGIPRALLEAMSLSLLCVAPDVGGIGPLLRGRGWVVPPLNDIALAAVLTAICTDATEGNAFGGAASAFVRDHFDINVVAAAYMNVFEK